MEILAVALLGFAAYLIGSITPAYYLVRYLKGTDIRSVGSKNVGTLNTFHTLGPAWALMVLLFDAGKGVVAVLLPGWVGLPDWTVFVTGPLVMAGHNWPAALMFRGGKGAATFIGICLAMFPIASLIAIVPGLLMVLVSRNAIVGLTVGYIAVNLLVLAAWLFGLGWLVTDASWVQLAFSLLLTLMVAVVYGVSIRGQLLEACRQRSIRQVFYGT